VEVGFEYLLVAQHLHKMVCWKC